MLTHEQEETETTLSQEEVLSSGLMPDDNLWVNADEGDTPEAPVNETEIPLAENDAETDTLVERYFSNVRRYALLSREEERALWRRIAHWQARRRRVLYTSPIALPTLSRVKDQVEHEALSLDQVFHDVGATASQQAVQRTRLEEAVVDLQDLGMRLHDLAAHSRSPASALQRRALRHERTTLWQQWMATCEALQLHPHVYESMHAALDLGHHTQPDDPALQAAHSAWAHAQRKLEQDKTQMMQANLRLVIHIAKRYRNRGIPFLDLIQEGNIGLMRALDKFEPQRGLKFVTYAYWWIRQAIGRAVAEQHRTIRLPVHVTERTNKLRAASEQLWQVHGREPSVQELSAVLGWTAAEIENLRSAVQPITRLHQPISEDGDEPAWLLKDTQAPKLEALLAEAHLHRHLLACLASLPEREALILRLRYGLESEHPHTLREIGDVLGLSRERIRQIEKQAFEKLRQPRLRAMLADFADVAEDV
jgi:RNA polymerase sigma factor (sigma-70 family)